MTPKAKLFVAANDRSPVVSGHVNEPDPNKPGKGATYRLKTGLSYRLSLEDCRSLPEGYPKWELG